MTQPTGVFVRLPLSDDEKMALTSGVKMGGNIEQGILAIGTPVTSGDLHEVGIEVVHAHGSDLTYCRDHAQKIATGADGIIYSLVRQSDHQSAIAALEAEVGRLLGIIGKVDGLIMGNNAPIKIFVAVHSLCQSALKGPEA